MASLNSAKAGVREVHSISPEMGYCCASMTDVRQRWGRL
jgi:hypothetical protein